MIRIVFKRIVNTMANSSSSQPRPHVVFFPYMARGHTLPLLDMSMAFVSRGMRVTIITTPKNAPFILANIKESPHISLSTIRFPSPPPLGLPEGCENTHDLPRRDMLLPFMFAITSLREPFHALLRDMSTSGDLPIVVVSDLILFWTLDVCRSFGIPRIGAHVGGVLLMAVLRTAFLRHSREIFGASPGEPISILELPFTFNKTDFIDSVLQQDPNNLTPSMGPMGESDAESWGTIVNTFHELEHRHVPTLQSHYKNPIWCLGPFRLHRQQNQDDKNQHQPYYIEWLDKTLAKAGLDSVIYVSFGSEAEADLTDEQIEEIACGLEAAGHPFILVTRSTTWAARGKEGVGLVVKDWVDQQAILDHPATGAFLSHCGWNSVIESMSMGVPILGWPLGADQPLNAKIVCYEFEAGLIMPQEFNEMKTLLIGRETIKTKVEEMMGGEIGGKVREKAKGIGRSAKLAVEKGGSSFTNLDHLVERLIAFSESK